MPRLRNTNTKITDRSQISEGDLLIYHGNLWDTIGHVTMSSGEIQGEIQFRLDQVQTNGRDRLYSINTININTGRIMKINGDTYYRMKLEQEAYKREHGYMDGYRTGLFPNA